MFCFIKLHQGFALFHLLLLLLLLIRSYSHGIIKSYIARERNSQKLFQHLSVHKFYAIAQLLKCISLSFLLSFVVVSTVFLFQQYFCTTFVLLWDKSSFLPTMLPFLINFFFIFSLLANNFQYSESQDCEKGGNLCTIRVCVWLAFSARSANDSINWMRGRRLLN